MAAALPKPPMTAEQTREYLLCAMDPEHFISSYLKVRDKRLEKDVPFELMPHQRKVVNGYETRDRNLVQKYRQGGITSISCAYMAYLLTFNDGYLVGVVADKLNLAENIVKTVADMMLSVPDWMRAEAQTDNNRIKNFDNKSEIRAFAASADGTRGFTPDFLFIDEAAYMTYGEEFMASAKGTMSVSGKMVLNSTPKGQDPVYYKTYESAMAGRNKYNVIEIFWYEDPRFSVDLAWIKGDEKILVTEPGQPFIVTAESQARNAELRAAGYFPRNPWYYDMCAEYEGDLKRIRSEIEGEFVGSGGTMVDETLLMQQSKDYVRDPIARNTDKDGHCWIFAQPVEGATYIISADISYGGNDYHGLQIIRDGGTEVEQVVEYQCQIPPESLALVMNHLGRLYNDAYAVVDVTGGAGAVVMRELILLKYTNLHFSEINAKVTRDMLKGSEKTTPDGKVLVPGFLINGMNRPIMLGMLKRFIENGWLIIRSSRLIAELKSFVWNATKNRWDHSRSSHDDLIFGVAMALFVREYKVAPMARLNREQWLAIAAARAPRTAGDAPPVQYDEYGNPEAKITTRAQLFNQYQEDGPVGGRTEGPSKPKFVVPYITTKAGGD
jgi:hypothetical protein